MNAAPGCRRAEVTHLIRGPTGIGVPYRAGGTDLAKGADCKYLAWEGLRACGIDVPWSSLIGGVDISESAMEDFFASQDELWEEVPEAERLGDVVVTECPTGPHLAVLVDERAQKVLTTSLKTGARLLSLRTLGKPTSVRRFRGGRGARGVVT